MRRVLIVEDEAPAARRLARLVAELRPQVELLGPCDTVTAAREVFAEAKLTGTGPDVLLCDIELADGLSFRLWEEAEVPCPVIFTTAYDQYALRAFRVNSVDYLLKPIESEQLAAALERFEARRQPGLPADLVAQLAAATAQRAPSYRSRVAAQRGEVLRPLPVREVAQFFSEDRLTFALTHDGKRHHVGEPVARLAEELDPTEWFRINRAQLVHIDGVLRAEPYFNHRLKLTLSPPSPDEGAASRSRDVVARERVRAFRNWLDGRAAAGG